MPKIDDTKQAEVKREIAMAMAVDPLISSWRLQKVLFEKGYKSSSGGHLHRDFILKLVKKINGEARYNIQNSEIEDRMIETRQRFKVIFERLFKIAFWQWDFMNEGIMMPEVKDQIKAMEALMKMDIALISAEMDAGIFKRNLGTLEIEHRRNVPLTPERKQAIIIAFQNAGLIPPVMEKLPEHAPAQITTQSGGAQ